MKVTFLTGSASRTAGGLFFSVRALACNIRRLGASCAVISYHDGQQYESDYSHWSADTLNLVKHWGPSNFKFSLGHKSEAFNTNPDVMHLHGLWMHQSLTALHFSKAGGKVVISPRGMLDSWAVNNRKLVKQIVGKMFEHENIRRAAAFIALNKKEAASIRDFGYQGPIFVIPNGVDDFKHEESNICKPACHDACGYNPYFAFLGRYDKKKGVLELVDAWEDPSNPLVSMGYELRLAGWGGSEMESMLQAKCGHSKSGTVFLGPALYGEAKANFLARADAFVLPSYSEGLPMAVLEAWSFGCLTLLTPQCNLEDSFGKDFCIKIASPAKNDILDAFHRYAEYGVIEKKAASRLAKEYARMFYDWEVIAQKTLDVYNWTCGRRFQIPDSLYEG